ncbi:MAG: MOSC domain-containing protein [Clostridia bacterium]
MEGIVVAVCISEKKGVIKHAVESIKLIEDFGIEGDAHAEKGSIRQISFLGRESVKKMEDLGVRGLCFGKFAENICTEGIVLHEIPVGTLLEIGNTIQEVTQIGKKCHAADGCEVARLVGTCIMPKEGIFTKVVKGGTIKAGDIIKVLP